MPNLHSAATLTRKAGLVIILLVRVAGGADAADPPVKRVPEVRQDAQFVNDLADLDFSRLVGHQNQSWIVARLSGACGVEVHTTWDISENGEHTFEPVDSPVEFWLQGGVETIASIAGPPCCVRGYSQRMNADALRPTLAKFYSAFDEEDGGTAICRVNEGFGGFGHLRPAVLIPDAWTKFVLPAVKYLGGTPQLLEASSAEKIRQPLAKLLSNDNPFLSIEACRRLTNSGQLDNATWLEALRPADTIRQGVLVRIALQFGSVGAREERLKLLANACESAHRVEEVRGISLALLVTEVARSPRITPFMTKPLLRAIEQKFGQSAALSDSDKYLLVMVHAAGSSEQ
jgi:hypothetical protein